MYDMKQEQTLDWYEKKTQWMTGTGVVSYMIATSCENVSHVYSLAAQSDDFRMRIATGSPCWKKPVLRTNGTRRAIKCMGNNQISNTSNSPGLGYNERSRAWYSAGFCFRTVMASSMSTIDLSVCPVFGNMMSEMNIVSYASIRRRSGRCILEWRRVQR